MLDQLEKLPFIVFTLMVEKKVTSGWILKSTLKLVEGFLDGNRWVFIWHVMEIYKFCLVKMVIGA